MLSSRNSSPKHSQPELKQQSIFLPALEPPVCATWVEVVIDIFGVRKTFLFFSVAIQVSLPPVEVEQARAGFPPGLSSQIPPSRLAVVDLDKPVVLSCERDIDSLGAFAVAVAVGFPPMLVWRRYGVIPDCKCPGSGNCHVRREDKNHLRGNCRADIPLHAIPTVK